MTEFALHPDAYKDLEELWESVAEDSIAAADRLIADIFETLDRLATFPDIGHRRPDLTRKPLRFHSVRDYLIAYAPDERPV